MTNAAAIQEIRQGTRFEFGRNWERFLSVLNEERIREAERSLSLMLRSDRLDGRSFLDIGSGSGLFSLAAYRLGARVFSMDFDPKSVACTRELRARYAGGDQAWEIREGSVLDTSFMKGLGTFDIVYSWGVLHHTGNLAGALTNAAERVKPGGQLFIAIYNDQGARSRLWRKVKRLYCSSGFGKAFVLGSFIPYFAVRGFVVDLLKRTNPARRYRDYKRQRGMSLWYDWFDWLGGLPFEVAKPEEIFERFYRDGFQLENLRTTGSWGCNEYVFRRSVPI